MHEVSHTINSKKGLLLWSYVVSETWNYKPGVTGNHVIHTGKAVTHLKARDAAYKFIQRRKKAITAGNDGWL
jgi:hypothetical protein